MQKGQPKFGIVCARGLGDALLSMVLARNLSLSGYSTTIFSSILCGLKEWFPGFNITPYPSADQFQTIYSSFDTVIAADHSAVGDHHDFGNRLLILKEDGLDKTQTMVTNLQRVCRDTLKLPVAETLSGITPLPGYIHRAHPKRVILHPMSTDIKKNWPPHKFVALAERLAQEGYDPHFCVSPQEAQQWKQYVPPEKLPLFPLLSDLAAYIYESGYLIGNDSGLGHLASALNVPTLSIFARSSYARLWRPGWGVGRVVSPPPLLPGARLKQTYWKKLLTTQRVLRAFIKMREER